MYRIRHRLLAAASAVLVSACRAPDTPPPASPVGAESTRTKVLEAGSTLLQGEGPLAGHDVHLVGFHPMKDDPEPQVAEQALMRDKISSYGKTRHTWSTHDGDMPQHRLPLGPPALACSFSRDGGLRPGLLQARDTAMQVSTEAVRRERQALVEHARPRRGVDVLAG